MSLEPFTGFPKEGFDFLRGLAKKNDKKFFDENRAIYDEYVVAPSRSFVVAMGDQLRSRVSKTFVAIPKANGSLGRINRDVRFSKDKRPYNTHLHFRFWDGKDKKSAPGVGMWISPDGVGIAVGLMQFDKPALAKYRKAVLDAKAGPALEEAYAAATKAKAKVGEPHYKKVPKGFDADHPRADWLRWTHVGVMMRVDTPKLVHTAKFATWCGERVDKLAPVHHWLTTHVF